MFYFAKILDEDLEPYTRYEYSLSATNKAGTQSTDYQPIRTSESAPTGLAPPTASVTPDSLYEIELMWTPPDRPNGVITEYSLWRSVGGPFVEIYRGNASITDSV